MYIQYRYYYYCQISMKLEYFDKFFEVYSILNSMTILPVGAEFFHANRTDRQTDMTKLIVAFRSFANAPLKQLIWC